MTREDIRTAVVGAIVKVAPEARHQALAGDVSLRDQLDLDSMDLLNVMVGIHAALGVDIPEADYGKLTTLDGAVAYLEARLASR